MKRLLLTIAILLSFAAAALAQDASTSGNITGLAQAVEIDTNGFGTVAVDVSNTWVATLKFQATIDGTNFFDLPSVLRISDQTTVGSTTANDRFLIASAGYQKVRVLSSLFSSGTATIALTASAPTSFPAAVAGGAASNVTVVNAAPIDVNCASGCTPGTSFLDGGSFTVGATAFSPIGGTRIDAPVAIGNGLGAAARITRFRALHMNLRDDTTDQAVGVRSFNTAPVNTHIGLDTRALNLIRNEDSTVGYWQGTTALQRANFYPGVNAQLPAKTYGDVTLNALNAQLDINLSNFGLEGVYVYLRSSSLVGTVSFVTSPGSSSGNTSVYDTRQRTWVDGAIVNPSASDTLYCVPSGGLGNVLVRVTNYTSGSVLASASGGPGICGVYSNVTGSTVGITGTVPLPTGASTAALQATGNTSLASIDTKTPALVGGRQPVDGSGVTQPVSAASLPLPTGAATEATLSTLNGKIVAVDTGAVVVSSSALPTGAASSANQTNGTQTTQLNGGGNTATVTAANALKTDSSATTQPVSAASLPLPTGAATSSLQTTGNTSLGNIDTKTPALVSGRVPVDGSGVTQPVSATTLPLPTGAATSANQTNGTERTKITNGTVNAEVMDTDPSGGEQGVVVRVAGILPEVFGDFRLIDSGNVANVTAAGALKVDGSAVTQPVSGPLTDTQLRATPVPTSAAQSGNWNSRTQDGSGNAIPSSTAVPLSTDRGLNVRQVGTVTTQLDGAFTGDGAPSTLDAIAVAGWDGALNRILKTSATGEVIVGGVTGNVQVTQPTASQLNAQVQGPAASGATKSGNPVQTGGVFNTVQPTVATGQVVESQATARGASIVATGVDPFSTVTTFAQPSATTTSSIGAAMFETTLLAANAARKGAFISNQSQCMMFVKFGTGISSSSFTFLLQPGELRNPFSTPNGIYTGVITAIWSCLDGLAIATEM